jgi:hypothetical protein
MYPTLAEPLLGNAMLKIGCNLVGISFGKPSRIRLPGSLLGRCRKSRIATI